MIAPQICEYEWSPVQFYFCIIEKRSKLAAYEFKLFLGTEYVQESDRKSKTLLFFVLKGLVIQTDMDYSHLQLSDGRYKDLALFDASASYKIKQFTIKLSANNLLDQKAYSYTVFNGLNIHSYDFALRPREVVLSIQFTM